MSDKDLEFWDDDGNGFLETVRAWPEGMSGPRSVPISVVFNAVRSHAIGSLSRASRLLQKRCDIRAVHAWSTASRTQVCPEIFIADAFMKDSKDGSEMRASDRRRIEARLARYKRKYSQHALKRVH